MADRACSIEGCEKPVEARGWCSAHYNRWKRTGDPLTTLTSLKPAPACSIDECEQDFYGRGFCRMHWHRARKWGDPNYKPFLPTVCQMDDCDKPTGIPAASCGLCRRHYKYYLKWGDPYFEGFERVRSTCVIEGCDDFVIGRGWCSKHYHRWKWRGAPVGRRRGEVVDGKRICSDCGVDKPLSDYRSKPCYCRECVNRQASERRVYVPVERTESICGGCGSAFMADKRRNRYCSSECAAARKNTDNWVYLNARRARLRDAFVESFDRAEIFKRDNWVCGICREPVDKRLKFPHPMSASLDHVVPIVRGGKHSRENAQTSHFHCNVVKSDRLIGASA